MATPAHSRDLTVAPRAPRRVWPHSSGQDGNVGGTGTGSSNGCATGSAETKNWTPVAPWLQPRAGLAHAVLGGELFIFEGEGNPTSTLDVDVYDPIAEE